MGITTLILFIAAIVTAAVAAGVIIYTTQSLQQKSIVTAQEAQQRITEGITINRVLGYQFDKSSNSLNRYLQQITLLSAQIQLSPGSGPINMQDLSILYTDSNGNIYSYLTSREFPSAIYAYISGGNYIVTGFVINNTHVANNITIENPGRCSSFNYNKSGPYIYVVNVNNSTCYIYINESILYKPLQIEDLFMILKNMNEIGIGTPYALLGVVVKEHDVYLSRGEIYEVLLYLPTPLYPNDEFNLQISAISGYKSIFFGVVPSVLYQTAVFIGGS